MKIIMITVISIGLSIFWGCSSAKFGWEAEPGIDEPAAENASGFVEDFDPLSLEEEDIKVTPLPGNETPQVQTLQPAVTHHAEEAESADMVQGYRVQLFASENGESAKDVKRRAIFKFTGERVDMIFKPPHYKILVGDFIELKDARKFAEEAKSRGFHDAWAVPARVNPNHVPQEF